MSEFIFSQFMFYFALFAVLFLPGFFLLSATKIGRNFSTLENFVLSFGVSITTVNFLMIILGKTPFGITKTSLLITLAALFSICFGFYYRNKEKIKHIKLKNDSVSKKSTILVLILLFLTIFIKTVYLKDAIFPTATDLGHHMYWAKKIAVTGQLPVYEKAEIGNDHTIERPSPIADFIIGEHLIFAAIALISNADFVSSFPALTLFLLHIVTLLAIFVLSKSLFQNSKYKDTIAISALLFAGPLYSIASPQAKFVSGGVIGNNIGNLLIPILILLFSKALIERSSKILALALFISLGLAYSHHLSTFIFVFVSIFTVLFYCLYNIKSLRTDLKDWTKMILTREVILTLVLGFIFILFLYTPTYLNVSAVDTAVGTPSKATRTGLTIDQLKATAGEARFAFAFIGFIVLLFAKKLGKFNQAFLLGWLGAITIMSLRPNWLLIDIPSNRVASYIVFPIAVVSAFVFVTILKYLRTEISNKNYLNPSVLVFSFFVLIAFLFANGQYENAMSLNSNGSSLAALQTYEASKYLSTNLNAEDVVLKDHNYISGDAWIKLYFMNGYNFPLSRGFFKRYEDETKPREQCTNLMISLPNGDEAKKCFEGTKTDFIMVNPDLDSAQFHRLNEFWQVYSSDEVGVFYKNN